MSDDLAMDGATRMWLVVLLLLLLLLLLLSALGEAWAAALAQVRWGAPRASSPLRWNPSSLAFLAASGASLVQSVATLGSRIESAFWRRATPHGTCCKPEYQGEHCVTNDQYVCS